METFNLSKKNHHNWSFVVCPWTATQYRKEVGRMINCVSIWDSTLSLWNHSSWPRTTALGFISTFICNYPHASPTSHLTSSWSFLGGFSLFRNFYVRPWPGAALPPLGIPQVWCNAGRLLLSKLTRNVPTKRERRWRWRWRLAPPASRGKHSASLFSYLCIPFLTSLCFKITPLR